MRASWDDGEAEATTSAEGAFQLPVSAPSRAQTVRIWAEAPDGRVGFGVGAILPDEPQSEVQPIELKRAGQVILRTIGHDGAPAPDAKLQIFELLHVPRMGDQPIPRFARSARTDARARATLRLPEAKFRVWAFAPNYGRAEVDFTVGAREEEIEVRLPRERALTVVVRDQATDDPVKDALVVTVVRYRDYGNADVRTDAHGEARLRGIGEADPVSVMVIPPGTERPRPGARHDRRHTVPKGERELVVRIDLRRSISWPVRDGGHGIPPDGTQIVIDSSASSGNPFTGLVARIENGRLVARDCPAGHIHAIAHAPDRTAASLFCRKGEQEGPEIAFTPVCDIEFLIRNPDGSPAPGTRIGLFGPGNNLMRKVETGEDGRARMGSLFGSLANLSVLQGPGGSMRRRMGTVDLRKGDLKIEFTLPELSVVDMRAVLDGTPGWPEGSRLWLGFFGWEDPKVDEQAGRFQAKCVLPPPGTKLSISMFSPGYRIQTAELVVPPRGEPLRHTFELTRGLDLRVRTIGSAPKSLSLELQMRKDGRWTTIDSPNIWPRRTRNSWDGGYAFPGMEPGRYRYRDRQSRIVVAETELKEDGTGTLVLDYARIWFVRGRVEMPEGFDRRNVRVEWVGVSEEDGIGGRGGARVDPNSGAFSLLALEGQPGRVRAVHKLLSCAPLRVDGPTDDVVLTLEKGPTILFRLPDSLKLPLSFHPDSSGIRVRLYAGEAFESIRFSGAATKEGGRWRIGGVSEGVYTLFVNTPGALPMIRHGFTVKAGTNDLGDLPMDPGATLRIRVRVKEPFAPPRISAWAVSLDSPRYSRGVSSNGETVVEVPGLRPGRYRITAHILTGMMGRPPIEEEIDV
ncbi:MAG: hypothetical protein AAGD14_12005, partial [Planctomycetota bacterium]